ncbi:MAG: amino acid adenylation domain-containing protein, partial [Sphingobacteriales bacterium]
MLAVFKSGAAYVPLDPDYPNKRLEYMLEDSKARFLITNAKYQHELNTEAEVIILEDMLLEMNAQSREELPLVKENDLAYILYTSGSTGQPKGVMIEHRNLTNLLQSIEKFPGLNESDKLLSLTTISFDISVLEIFLPLTVGATLVVAHTDVGKDGEAILNIIKENDITFMQATPSTYKMMLAAEWEEKFDMKATCCGEQLPKDLADKILKKCSRLFNMYGPTETTIYSTGKEIFTSDEIIAIGTPIKDTDVYILNDQHELVKKGEVGEICIGGAGVARGYFGKPDLTDQKFISFNGEHGLAHRLYKTGDLGKILETGEIQCLGRIDHQIKIRGYRIETGEIEYFLKQQTDITEALVTSWTGPTGDKRIAAYVTSNTEISLQDAPSYFNKWKQLLRSAVPYYMVPNDFILIREFPLTENGKVDRKSLPHPTITNTYSNADDSLPRNAIESLIAEVWAEHLGMDSVGVYDNFFDLGGHSLTAVKVIVQIKKKTGKYLPLASLFKNPTIAELANLLSDEKESGGFESLVPLKTSGSKIPLYIVHGLGSTAFKFYDFAHQLDTE